MGFDSRNLPAARLSLVLAVATLFSPACRGDYSISNNLSGTSGGVETATGTSLLAAGFGSGAGGQLSGVTLALVNFVPGTAEVDIYNDGGAEPGASVGVLTLSSGFVSGTANPTFAASGITLAANTNYWIVLKALGAASVNWSWTATNAGTGAGYQNTWGQYDDSFGTWFTYNSYPTQMNVLIASSAVPEPSSLILWGFGAAGVTLGWLRRRPGGGSTAASPV